MAGVLGDALADRGGKVKVIKGRSARRVPLGQCGDRGGRFRCGAKGIRTLTFSLRRLRSAVRRRMRAADPDASDAC